MLSSIDLPEDDVERADEGDDVGDQVALDEGAEALQVTERGWADAEPVRIGRLAVADDEVTKLSLGRLNRVVGLARRRLDEARHLADNRSFRNACGGLPADLDRLAEFFPPHQIPVL